MITLARTLAIAAFALPLFRATAQADGRLAAGFADPPKPAKPSTYYLLLNGTTDRARMDFELESFHALGLRGLCVFDMGARGPEGQVPPAGPAFLSDAWLDSFAHLLEKAGQLDMDVQLAVSSSWDMGGAKDFSVAASQTDTADASFAEVLRASLEQHTNPQRFGFSPVPATYLRLRIYGGHGPEGGRVQLAEFEAYDTDGRNVAGGHAADRTREGAKLVRSPGDLGDYDLWASANINDGRRTGANGSWSSPGPPPLVVRDRADVRDLLPLFKDGRLSWDVPPGKWTLIRYVCANTGETLKVPSPNSDGLAADNFSAKATTAYIRGVTDRLEARLGDLRQTALTHLYLPSYEVRGAIWTDDFPERFQACRGYDPRPFLPALNGTFYRIKG
jgi:hypothetical protein